MKVQLERLNAEKERLEQQNYEKEIRYSKLYDKVRLYSPDYGKMCAWRLLSWRFWSYNRQIFYFILFLFFILF